MAKSNEHNDLKEIKYILMQLLAIELWRGGLSQLEIGKHINISVGSVNKMLKGVSRRVILENEDSQ